jgi:hypothetical protein
LLQVLLFSSVFSRNFLLIALLEVDARAAAGGPCASSVVQAFAANTDAIASSKRGVSAIPGVPRVCPNDHLALVIT